MFCKFSKNHNSNLSLCNLLQLFPQKILDILEVYLWLSLCIMVVFDLKYLESNLQKYTSSILEPIKLLKNVRYTSSIF